MTKSGDHAPVSAVQAAGGLIPTGGDDMNMREFAPPVRERPADGGPPIFTTGAIRGQPHTNRR